MFAAATTSSQGIIQRLQTEVAAVHKELAASEAQVKARTEAEAFQVPCVRVLVTWHQSHGLVEPWHVLFLLPSPV